MGIRRCVCSDVENSFPWTDGICANPVKCGVWFSVPTHPYFLSSFSLPPHVCVSVIDAFNFPVHGEFYQIENVYKKRRTLLSILANAAHRWNVGTSVWQHGTAKFAE